MAATVARIGREKSLGRLVKSVYNIKGRGAPERRRLAEAALLRANPQLAREAAFQPGAMVVVPDLRDEDLADDLKDVQNAPDEALERLGAAISDVSRRAKSAFEAAAKSSEETLANLDSDELKGVVSKTAPDLAEQLGKVKATAEARQAANKDRASQVSSLLKQARKDLKAMRRGVG